MRILITNDDGVLAPGIAALAKGIQHTFGAEHEILVVAPLTDWSGAGAAVGAVYERESIPYEAIDLPGLSDIHVYGVDGPPALCTILACIEGFGPQPDLVVSGINNGVNIGRSALHSGTVGAALTAAQFGLRALAVSVEWNEENMHWETPVHLACQVLPTLFEAEPRTVLNLNVPARPLSELAGVRHGTLGTVGLIRTARSTDPDSPLPGTGIARVSGAIVLTYRGMSGDPTGTAKERAELEPASDAAAIADGWASLTPLVGVREDASDGGVAALERGLAALLA